MATVPTSLRRWFVFHFVADLFFAIFVGFAVVWNYYRLRLRA